MEHAWVEEEENWEDWRAWTVEDTHAQARALSMLPLVPVGVPPPWEQAPAPELPSAALGPELGCPSLCCLFAVQGALSVTDVAGLSGVARAWKDCGPTRLAYLEALKDLFVFDVPLFSERFAWDAMSRGAAFPVAAASKWYWPSRRLAPRKLLRFSAAALPPLRERED